MPRVKPKKVGTAGTTPFEIISPGVGGTPAVSDAPLETVSPELDPTIMMRYSNDWGQSYSNYMERSLGKLGEYQKRVIWTRCGQGRQRVFEVSGSAACRIAINAALIEAKVLKS